MALLGFKKQFADAVASGLKCQTIRAARRHPIRVGEKLYLYTGLRTRACRKLGEGICTSVEPILIYSSGFWLGVWQSGREVSGLALLDLIRADGFETEEDFFCFFLDLYGRTFEGVVIRWRPLG